MEDPARKVRTYLRERYGTHGVERFWHELASEESNNWVLAKRWHLSLWDVRCVRQYFAAFSRLVFPAPKKGLYSAHPPILRFCPIFAIILLLTLKTGGI
jgi:hypothetical protein